MFKQGQLNNFMNTCGITSYMIASRAYSQPETLLCLRLFVGAHAHILGVLAHSKIFLIILTVHKKISRKKSEIEKSPIIGEIHVQNIFILDDSCNVRRIMYKYMYHTI